MARLNKRPVNTARTHEGAPAVPNSSALNELKRAVLAAFLWEDQYYESGESLADRIAALVPSVSQEATEALAIEARTVHNLRHVPMWLLVARLQARLPVSATAIAGILLRADEPAEFLSMYWKDGKRPIPASVKRGLAMAMQRFDAYQLAKYDRKVAIRMRDVLRLVHPTPKDDEQAENWKKLIAGELEAPNTWEVRLSAGENKKAVFEELLGENKLGYMALLRNLRKMEEVGVDRSMINEALRARKGAHNVLPFRFVAAAQAAPSFERAIDDALLKSVEDMAPFSGSTAVLVDVSGSMAQRLSGQSDLSRLDAAAVLASVLPGDVRTFVFDDTCREIPARKGMAGVESIKRQRGGCTYLGAAIAHVGEKMNYDRLIVITDDQSHDRVGAPRKGSKGYMINVASYKNGVGFGDWVRINGFSESVLKFIRACEDERLA